MKQTLSYWNSKLRGAQVHENTCKVIFTLNN